MKVLHVESGNLFGGVETMLATIAAHAGATPGTEHAFALAYDGPLAEALAVRGASVHRLGPVRVRNLPSILRGRAALEGAIVASGADLVVLHSWWAHALFGGPLRRRRRRFATWVHDLTDGSHWLERWAARTRPAAFLTSSRFIAGGLSGRYPGIPTEVVHCPVALATAPPDARPRIRAEMATAPDSTVILHAARLEEWKGQELLLDALAGMAGDDRWTGWIAGGAQRPAEAAYLERLRERAQSLGIGGRIRFAGQRSDIPALLAAADVFVQPNRRPEPFGIAVVEAMLAGLPVVATAMGGVLEIVDPWCGVLVPPDDPRAMASALGALAGDPALRRFTGGRAIERAREISDPAAQMRRLDEALRRIAEARA